MLQALPEDVEKQWGSYLRNRRNFVGTSILYCQPTKVSSATWGQHELYTELMDQAATTYWNVTSVSYFLCLLRLNQVPRHLSCLRGEVGPLGSTGSGPGQSKQEKKLVSAATRQKDRAR